MTILIYRLGRIGDTMMALPALRLVQRAFADQRRVLLTERAPSHLLSAPHLLAGTAIIDGCIQYRRGERHPAALWRLARQIRGNGAHTVVYLTEPRGAATIWRDRAFFRLCGIRRFVGLPVSRDLRTPRPGESEAGRLARTIADLGDCRLDDPANWRLALSDGERAEAIADIAGWTGGDAFVALDVTAKPAAKEWGEDNWRMLLALLSRRFPGLGALFTGGPADAGRVGRLAAAWRGPVLDRCGQTPRQFHAMAAHARLFVGGDSGPAHLAAAAGIPVVAVTSGQYPCGMWDPVGQDHAVIRQSVSCAPCRSLTCRGDHVCMAALAVEPVLAACLARLPINGLKS